MKLPVEIVFERRSEGIEADVRERAAWLDQFYDSLVRCRVVVAIPHRHREKGNHHQVRIDLTVPGDEIVVNHEATLRGALQDLDEPRMTKAAETETVHKHLRVTIREAFDVARRRLQDFARRQSGRVKQHEPPPHGRVARLFPEDGYGFIESADGREIYFHRHSVLHDGFDELEVGTEVAFAEEPGDKGPQASTVRALDVHHYRCSGRRSRRGRGLTRVAGASCRIPGSPRRLSRLSRMFARNGPISRRRRMACDLRTQVREEASHAMP